MKNTFEELKIIFEGKKQGVVNGKREIVVPPIYDEVTIWDNGIEVEKDGRVGGYNFDGKLIVPIEFTYVNFWEYFITVYKDSFNGAYDYEGNNIIPVDHYDLEIYGKIAVAKALTGYGVYNEKGELIVPFKYTTIQVYMDIVVAELYDEYEFYTADGTAIRPGGCRDYDVCQSFIVAFCDYESTSIFCKTGKLLAKIDNQSDFCCNKDYFAVKVCGRWKVYDKTGKCLDDEGFEDVFLAEEFVNVKKDGHWKVLCECE